LGRFACRAVLPARASVAKRLLTSARRAVAPYCSFLADLSVWSTTAKQFYLEFAALPF
jgi:hypothetical protein